MKKIEKAILIILSIYSVISCGNETMIITKKDVEATVEARLGEERKLINKDEEDSFGKVDIETPLPTPTPEPVPTPTPELVPTPTPELVPTPTPQLASKNILENDLKEIKEMALALINSEREKLNLSPLEMGSSLVHQSRADESYDTRFFGTTFKDGNNIKTLFSKKGGNSYIDNVAYMNGYYNELSDGTTSWAEEDSCKSGLYICEKINPEEEIKYAIKTSSFIDEITKGKHKKINIGIAFDEYVFYLYLGFEGGDFIINNIDFSESNFELEVHNLSKNYSFSDKNIQIFKEGDFNPIFSEIEYLTKNRQNNSQHFFHILDPPEEGYHYSDIDPDEVVAYEWKINDNKLSIKADVNKIDISSGLYRVMIWGENKELQSENLIDFVFEIDLEESTLKTNEESAIEDKPALDKLKQYVLDLINKDRADHGVDPVILGTDETAQIHADESFENDYHSHWFLSGEKPYMVYSRNGGKSYVSENAASETGGDNWAGKCLSESYYCNKIDIKNELKEKQWGMMYDDAHADWGHRDTIIDPKHTKVNIGIRFNDYEFSFIQHFEADHFEIENVKLDGSNLTFEIINNTMEYGYSDSSIVIIYDPLPEPLTTDWLNDDERSKAMGYGYCTGGGTNCYQDENGERILNEKEYRVAFILEPPGDGYFYSDLDPEDVVANGWQFTNQGNNTDPNKLRVKADLGDRLNKKGVYTLLIWGVHKETLEETALISHSIFKK